ncbi:MAG TPA: pyridoxamine 5'-phosphate oxidase family protein [Azospira sp.]|nr:pyridoxamine 5'-phosphate oxidase family protein [Azospira sp.]
MADIDNQPTEDLQGAPAGSKIREIAKRARTCMFTTDPSGWPSDSRPMSLQECDDDGTLWFLSSHESRKNRDVERDPRVMLSFANDDKYEYLVVHGQATVHADRATIDKYWTSFANAWFDGKDDPRVTVLRVRPEHGHYWQTQSGKIVALAKMSFSALTGAKTDDGGVDGELQPIRR